MLCQIGLCCLAVGIKRPTTWVKVQNHCCCLVASAALPPDDEIGLVAALCGIQCYPGCGVCKKLGDLQKAGGPPHTQEIER